MNVFKAAHKNATEEQKKVVGWELPKVYLQNGKYHFVNGNHRAWAQVQMGKTYIECEVEQLYQRTPDRGQTADGGSPYLVMLDGGLSLLVGQARKRSIEAKHKAALSGLINEFWHDHYLECWFPHVLLKYATKALKEDQSFFPIDKYTLDRDWKERATFLGEYDFLPCGDGNVPKERLLDGSEGYFYAYNGEYFVCLCVGDNYALWRLSTGKQDMTEKDWQEIRKEAEKPRYPWVQYYFAPKTNNAFLTANGFNK